MMQQLRWFWWYRLKTKLDWNCRCRVIVSCSWWILLILLCKKNLCTLREILVGLNWFIVDFHFWSTKNKMTIYRKQIFAVIWRIYKTFSH